VRSGATLDVAASALAHSAFDQAIVVDAGDRPIGAITLRLITRALSSMESESSAPAPAGAAAN
jgi:CBS domain-containing protein